ncbi:MAG: type IX secretion system outer membrane channel protein PorV [Bacteroidetes bacterium]|nr:type IX secretion system outer membrane channel protein PorV [Bacteroidota bacterium]
MTRSLRTGLAALSLLAAPAALAQVGGASVLFLQIEPDSRAGGMGNAGVALADNANAVFWNPAGLGFQQGTEFGLTYSKWLPQFDAGLSFQYGVVKYNMGKLGTLGAHITYFDLGKFQPTDENGTNIGDEIQSRDLAVGLSYGKELSDNLALGGAVRYINSDLASGTTVGGQTYKPGTAFAVDLGAIYRSKPFDMGGMNTTFRAGANLANFGSTINYTGQAGSDNPIPTNLRFGLGATFDLDEFNRVNALVDFNKQLYHVTSDSVDSDGNGSLDQRVTTVDSPFKALFSSWKTLTVDIDGDGAQTPEQVSALQQITIGGGLEYWYNQLFAMRVGGFYENPYNGNRKFLTLGAGLRYNIVGADFSYIYGLGTDSPLDRTLRFSLLIALNR